VAFKRLIVERSPGVAWFGVVLLVITYAMMKAYHPSFGAMVDAGAWQWLALYALGAYCIFRGLYGAWWRELRVDRQARTLETADGRILAFDKIGALSIGERELRAEGIEVPLYRSSFASELETMRAALEDVLGRRSGRPRVHRLRRLAYHRSWSLFVVTLCGFAVLVLAVGEGIVAGGSSELEYTLLAVIGVAISVLWFRRALFGSFSASQLHVDVPGGSLQLADGRVRRFAELGPLSIVERRDEYNRRRRYRLTSYELRAANHDEVLFASYEQAHTVKRLDALATAILAHELRHVLERVLDDRMSDGVFREGRALRTEIERVASGSPYLAAALAELSRDSDPAIAKRAQVLASA
jgi:hypothetical protein